MHDGEAKLSELLPRRNVYLLLLPFFFLFLFVSMRSRWKSHCNKCDNFTKASVVKHCYLLFFFLFLFIHITFITIVHSCMNNCCCYIFQHYIFRLFFFSNYYTTTIRKHTKLTLRFNRIPFHMNPHQTVTIQIDCKGVV